MTFPTQATKARKKRQADFLGALATGAAVKDAAKAAGVQPRTVYKWRDKDPLFAEEWQTALKTSLTALEREAARRALEGTKKPVYRGGELVGHVTEYSDSMLMFLLKRHGERASGEGTLEDQVKGARETLYEKFASALEGGGAAKAARKPDRA